MPTTVTPALNHAERFSSVGSTAPVAIIIDQGIGANTFFTNDGPPTFPAGNMVDALSHILMTNLTEVTATEYPHGMSS